ncbi:hypothetical protein NDU88_008876 [Pleurodeles waltl]|uniref:Uncharacterized protein n=1 Tax=Pleurodeles waltl TaxID=8319 RepID=A0AAV7RX07_PLEWA|nr:hypothetical protein NDU88_008876 [Pleurodeles waltl]
MLATDYYFTSHRTGDLGPLPSDLSRRAPPGRPSTSSEAPRSAASLLLTFSPVVILWCSAPQGARPRQGQSGAPTSSGAAGRPQAPPTRSPSGKTPGPRPPLRLRRGPPQASLLTRESSLPALRPVQLGPPILPSARGGTSRARSRTASHCCRPGHGYAAPGAPRAPLVTLLCLLACCPNGLPRRLGPQPCLEARGSTRSRPKRLRSPVLSSGRRG